MHAYITDSFTTSQQVIIELGDVMALRIVTGTVAIRAIFYNLVEMLRKHLF